MVGEKELATIQLYSEVVKLLPDPLQVFFCLFFDTVEYVAAIETPDAKPINRRNYVRGIFAFIEGTAYIFKRFALSQAASNPSLYTEGELFFLRDEARTPHDKKPTPGQTKFSRTDDNFQFGVNLLMRRWAKDYEVDTNGVGWQNFKKSLEMRHRITHPKTIAGLTITDEEMLNAAAAIEWALLVTTECAVAAVKVIEKEKFVEGQFTTQPIFIELVDMIKSFGGAFKPVPQ